MVMFLSRPEMYGKQTFDDGSSTKDIIEIVIGKQRNGPIGDVRLRFLKNYGRFLSTANVYGSDNYGLPDAGGQQEPKELPDASSRQPQFEARDRPGAGAPPLPDAFIAPDDAPF